ncbi:hypothetical protein SLEP1_g18702 [Rubroshorea leprosula]|uniref:Uncharacterized protein n=1 Tax=Rubroshorea leprosula TaxID=152421 RepID=A0AAV5J7D4_9ROSI|nr:hypothetical protein SLEP1_g18702 [Rubroshorea leprosula]
MDAQFGLTVYQFNLNLVFLLNNSSGPNWDEIVNSKDQIGGPYNNSRTNLGQIINSGDQIGGLSLIAL